MADKILSPSDGVTPTGDKVQMTSTRALAEFNIACSIWLPYMTPEDRVSALAYRGYVLCYPGAPNEWRVKLEDL